MDNYSWFTWSTTGEEAVYCSCPDCKKHITLEKRFIEPLLPKTIVCPYCDFKFELVLGTDKEKNEQPAPQEEADNKILH